MNKSISANRPKTLRPGAWIDASDVPDFILRAIKPAHVGSRCLVRDQAQSYLLAFDEPLQICPKTANTPFHALILPRSGKQVFDFRRNQHGARYWITFNNRLQQEEPSFRHPAIDFTSD
jgi:hypothetical protein